MNKVEQAISAQEIRDRIGLINGPSPSDAANGRADVDLEKLVRLLRRGIPDTQVGYTKARLNERMGLVYNTSALQIEDLLLGKDTVISPEQLIQIANGTWSTEVVETGVIRPNVDLGQKQKRIVINANAAQLIVAYQISIFRLDENLSWGAAPIVMNSWRYGFDFKALVGGNPVLNLISEDKYKISVSGRGSADSYTLFYIPKWSPNSGYGALREGATINTGDGKSTNWSFENVPEVVYPLLPDPGYRIATNSGAYSVTYTAVNALDPQEVIIFIPGITAEPTTFSGANLAALISAIDASLGDYLAPLSAVGTSVTLTPLDYSPIVMEANPATATVTYGLADANPTFFSEVFADYRAFPHPARVLSFYDAVGNTRVEITPVYGGTAVAEEMLAILLTRASLR